MCLIAVGRKPVPILSIPMVRSHGVESLVIGNMDGDDFSGIAALLGIGVLPAQGVVRAPRTGRPAQSMGELAQEDVMGAVLRDHDVSHRGMMPFPDVDVYIAETSGIDVND